MLKAKGSNSGNCDLISVQSNCQKTPAGILAVVPEHYLLKLIADIDIDIKKSSNHKTL